MIDLNAVGVELDGTTILEGVSLSIDDGQFLALVGPNGAGKTTLLRTINGLLSYAGTVRIDGRDVETLAATETGRLVATVPQETTLAFDFDVREVVAMGRTPHRSRFGTASAADREAVDGALERTDTEQFADRPVGELSGGQRQRVLLARALAQETPVLLLDEPTASLDINHQVATLSLARELVDEGKTVVAAVHDLDLAARFCDSMALLSDGELLVTGAPEAVLDAGRLERAFEVRTAVTTNPVTGTQMVTPLSDAPPGERRVHVIGTGERAARVVGALADAGVELSIGILPEGDAAVATARNVANEVVASPPFEPVPEAKRRSARRLVGAADVTVLTSSVAGANAAVASECERLIALDGTEPPTDAIVVEERELATVLEDHRTYSKTRS